MFSPYYALARARGRGDPENHVAMNVALYGRAHGWAMTERGRASLHRDASSIVIGASTMRWEADALTIEIDETTVPLPSRLRGRVTLRPRGLPARCFTLHAAGRHRWQPIAPLCDVTVAFDAPDLAWHGTGYFDANDGDEPLEAAFASWAWTRFDRGDRARIFYDVDRRDGSHLSLALEAREDAIVDTAPLPYHPLPRTGWGIARETPGDAGTKPTLIKTLENAPFYARSCVRATIDGEPANGVHETLSLDRVASPIVRLMLPFRMFRRAGSRRQSS